MKQILIAIDQLFNTFIGGMADETISAMAYRQDWRITQAIINGIFFDRDHCKKSYLSEVRRNHLPKGYQ